MHRLNRMFGDLEAASSDGFQDWDWNEQAASHRYGVFIHGPDVAVPSLPPHRSSSTKKLSFLPS